MRTLLVVVGTRPNLVKVTRFRAVAEAQGLFRVEVVHTGQHRDGRMSDVFFEQFGLVPDHFLGIPDSTPVERMAHIMLGLHGLVQQRRPHAMVVVGDVDSTLAAALTANKSGLPLVHLESGLRSGDMAMPEEVNRIITDRISAQCMVTEPSGRENLLHEGIAADRIHLVGNTMIDTLVAFNEQIERSPVLRELGLGEGGHVLVTMHRPGNVDEQASLERVVAMLEQVAEHRRIVFPVHPRTTRRLAELGLQERIARVPGLLMIGPQDYFAFQKLLASSAFVITDSGGVQEETTFRRIPCLTLRPSTERPITVTEGTNALLRLEELMEAIHRIEQGRVRPGRIPALWDGHATERVFEVLARVL